MDRKMRPSLHDVARRAGVSTATVSRCFNTPDKVSKNTRDTVMRVVDEITDSSGNVLDRITEQVGIIEVTNVLGQSSICKIVEGEAAEGDSLVPVG